MKKTIKLLLKPVKGILSWIAGLSCGVSRFSCYLTHKALFHITWGIPPSPDNFDHFIDIYYLWMLKKNPMFLKGGYSIGLQ
ncbi:MAG: hypothetical protein A2X45_02605 [Lentisphaerae bacterium GWF2_50_93]|nr:MAG: hypothetical protein A2X45_02605 [Lentisphaerae bacterium GWF2_50_93]